MTSVSSMVVTALHCPVLYKYKYLHPVSQTDIRGYNLPVSGDTDALTFGQSMDNVDRNIPAGIITLILNVFVNLPVH